MKTSKVKINDKEYMLCFSTRVAFACEERNSSISEEMNIIFNDTEKGRTKELFWLLYEMLKAGAKYSEIEGIENPALMSYDDLIDSLGVSDYSSLFSSVADAVKNGSERNVEVEALKNAVAPQRN